MVIDLFVWLSYASNECCQLIDAKTISFVRLYSSVGVDLNPLGPSDID